MVLREFHNGLRLLLSIDMDEFVAAGGDVVEWPAFRENPHTWFIRAPDSVAEKLWNLMQERTKR